MKSLKENLFYILVFIGVFMMFTFGNKPDVQLIGIWIASLGIAINSWVFKYEAPFLLELICKLLLFIIPFILAYHWIEGIELLMWR